MTVTNEAAKHAAELANAEGSFRGWGATYWKPESFIDAESTVFAAFAKYIQRVSDVAERCLTAADNEIAARANADLRALILPKPVDPLVEAICKTFGADIAGPGDIDKFRAELAKRGLTIVEAGDG